MKLSNIFDSLISSIIEIRNLNLYLQKRHILFGINMKIYKNTITALVGGNGSGKTSLLSILTGISFHSFLFVSYDNNCFYRPNQNIFRWNLNYGL